MEQQQIIKTIQARAKAHGLRIGHLCDRAGVHRTSFSRWKQSRCNPNPSSPKLESITKLTRVLDALDAAKACGEIWR